jgi:hypothetical protein
MMVARGHRLPIPELPIHLRKRSRGLFLLSLEGPY